MTLENTLILFSTIMELYSHMADRTDSKSVKSSFSLTNIYIFFSLWLCLEKDTVGKKAKHNC